MLKNIVFVKVGQHPMLPKTSKGSVAKFSIEPCKLSGTQPCCCLILLCTYPSSVQKLSFCKLSHSNQKGTTWSGSNFSQAAHLKLKFSPISLSGLTRLHDSSPPSLPHVHHPRGKQPFDIPHFFHFSPFSTFPPHFPKIPRQPITGLSLSTVSVTLCLLSLCL